jgi:hypothetical protein
MQNKHIRITYLKGCLFFSFDIGYLFKTPWSSDFIAERTSEEWLINLNQHLKNWDRFGFSRPEFTESEYGKTDRAPRNTFAKRHAKRLLPLAIKLVKSNIFNERNISFFTDSIRISPQGAISIRIIFELHGKISLSAKDTIDNYNHMLIKIPELLKKLIKNFIEFWNNTEIPVKLVPPNTELLNEILYSYEIIDFDFLLKNGNEELEVKSIKNIYVDQDIFPLCELSAVAKMSPSSVEILNDARLHEFIKTDIGGRDDELWSVSRDRMIRRHPDRHSIYNQAFFDDIKTATEILISQQATFDFLEEWVSRRRKLVVNKMLQYKNLTELEKDDLKNLFGEVMNVTQLLTEPVMLQKNVRHTFYIQAMTELSRCLEIKEEKERASFALRDFAQLIETFSSYRNAEIATSIGNLQIQLGKSTRRIGFLTVWITVLGIILGIIQVYIVFFGL